MFLWETWKGAGNSIFAILCLRKKLHYFFGFTYFIVKCSTVILYITYELVFIVKHCIYWSRNNVIWNMLEFISKVCSFTVIETFQAYVIQRKCFSFTLCIINIKYCHFLPVWHEMLFILLIEKCFKLSPVVEFQGNNFHLKKKT